LGFALIFGPIGANFAQKDEKGVKTAVLALFEIFEKSKIWGKFSKNFKNLKN
jgi:hypothetical protein